MKNSKIPPILKQIHAAMNILSQDELANELNASHSTIAGYGPQDNQQNYDKLAQIANFYNISIDYLLSGEVKGAQDINAEFYNGNTLVPQLVETFQPLPYESKLHILDYACYQKEGIHRIKNKSVGIHTKLFVCKDGSVHPCRRGFFFH